jgi:hypothetical protein
MDHHWTASTDTLWLADGHSATDLLLWLAVEVAAKQIYTHAYFGLTELFVYTLVHKSHD